MAHRRGRCPRRAGCLALSVSLRLPPPPEGEARGLCKLAPHHSWLPLWGSWHGVAVTERDLHAARLKRREQAPALRYLLTITSKSPPHPPQAVPLPPRGKALNGGSPAHAKIKDPPIWAGQIIMLFSFVLRWQVLQSLSAARPTGACCSYPRWRGRSSFLRALPRRELPDPGQPGPPHRR